MTTKVINIDKVKAAIESWKGTPYAIKNKADYAYCVDMMYPAWTFFNAEFYSKAEVIEKFWSLVETRFHVIAGHTQFKNFDCYDEVVSPVEEGNSVEATPFAIFDGKAVSMLKNAVTVENAVNTYVRRIMRKEYDCVADENGKIITKANLQACYDDWADTAIENMVNDGYDSGDYVVSVDDMLDNWSNRSWVVQFDLATGEYISIGNQKQFDLISALVEKIGVEEKAFSIE